MNWKNFLKNRLNCTSSLGFLVGYGSYASLWGPLGSPSARGQGTPAKPKAHKKTKAKLGYPTLAQAAGAKQLGCSPSPKTCYALLREKGVGTPAPIGYPYRTQFTVPNQETSARYRTPVSWVPCLALPSVPNSCKVTNRSTWYMERSKDRSTRCDGSPKAYPAYTYNENLNGSFFKNDPDGKTIPTFFNQCFDKNRLKSFVLWFLLQYGEYKSIQLVEQLKNVGFKYASKAGISLGIDDLRVPPKKGELIYEAEKQTYLTLNQYNRGEITGVERFQRLIDTWHRTSETLKQEVINHFEATDILNPVYMMAFSGARGNISQVRQLVGMRGLMADPQGQILDFPIRSNFREGLTLTEYIISSYGARKGIVDTALRTANAGYLTRRLVDVAQHVIISNFDCGTRRGIYLTNMKEGNKTIITLTQRLVGRILARDLTVESFSNKNSNYKRNEEITLDLAFEIGKKFEKVFVRSPLTCETPKLICQLCYGWSLAQGNLVSIGEAVGVVAAQSIGEPGTQLTMRTFHTGGVFSGDVSDQIRAPFNGFIEYVSAIPGTLIRTPEGKIAFLTKAEGSFWVHKNEKGNGSKKYKISPYTLLYKRNAQTIFEKEVIAQISSISQKSNATDDAALTIKSENEGEFYSKSLGFYERLVGPSPSAQAGVPKPNSWGTPTGTQDEGVHEVKGQHQKTKKRRDENRPHLSCEQPFLDNSWESDKIYEAWTWGYAWLLSGKIYELKIPSLLFPKLGDFVNTKSIMSETKWKFLTSTDTVRLNVSQKPSLGFVPTFSNLGLGNLDRNNVRLSFAYGEAKRPEAQSLLHLSSLRDKGRDTALQITNCNNTSMFKNNRETRIQGTMYTIGTGNSAARSASVAEGQDHEPVLFSTQKKICFDLAHIVFKKHGYIFHFSDFQSSLLGCYSPKAWCGSPAAGEPWKPTAKPQRAKPTNLFMPSMINVPSERDEGVSFAYSLKKALILQWFPKQLNTLTGGYAFIETAPPFFRIKKGWALRFSSPNPVQGCGTQPKNQHVRSEMQDKSKTLGTSALSARDPLCFNNKPLLNNSSFEKRVYLEISPQPLNPRVSSLTLAPIAGRESIHSKSMSHISLKPLLNLVSQRDNCISLASPDLREKRNTIRYQTEIQGWGCFATTQSHSEQSSWGSEATVSPQERSDNVVPQHRLGYALGGTSNVPKAIHTYIASSENIILDRSKTLIAFGATKSKASYTFSDPFRVYANTTQQQSLVATTQALCLSNKSSLLNFSSKKMKGVFWSNKILSQYQSMNDLLNSNMYLRIFWIPTDFFTVSIETFCNKMTIGLRGVSFCKKTSSPFTWPFLQMHGRRLLGLGCFASSTAKTGATLGGWYRRDVVQGIEPRYGTQETQDTREAKQEERRNRQIFIHKGYEEGKNQKKANLTYVFSLHIKNWLGKLQKNRQGASQLISPSLFQYRKEFYTTVISNKITEKNNTRDFMYLIFQKNSFLVPSVRTLGTPGNLKSQKALGTTPSASCDLFQKHLNIPADLDQNEEQQMQVTTQTSFEIRNRELRPLLKKDRKKAFLKYNRIAFLSFSKLVNCTTGRVIANDSPCLNLRELKKKYSGLSSDDSWSQKSLVISNYLTKEYNKITFIKNKEKFGLFCKSFLNSNVFLNNLSQCMSPSLKVEDEPFTDRGGALNKLNLIGTLKKGWILVPSTEKVHNCTSSNLKGGQGAFSFNQKDFTFLFHKKIVYPGQLISNSLNFNAPTSLVTECIFLKEIFNIQEISIHSILNLRKINLMLFESSMRKASLKKTIKEPLTLDFISKNSCPNNNVFAEISAPLAEKGCYPYSNAPKTFGLKTHWIKNHKSRFYFEANKGGAEGEGTLDTSWDNSARMLVGNKKGKGTLALILQPITEHYQENKVFLKQYVYEHTSTTNSVPNKLRDIFCFPSRLSHTLVSHFFTFRFRHCASLISSLGITSSLLCGSHGSGKGYSNRSEATMWVPSERCGSFATQAQKRRFHGIAGRFLRLLRFLAWGTQSRNSEKCGVSRALQQDLASLDTDIQDQTLQSVQAQRDGNPIPIIGGGQRPFHTSLVNSSYSSFLKWVLFKTHQCNKQDKTFFPRSLLLGYPDLGTLVDMQGTKKQKVKSELRSIKDDVFIIQNNFFREFALVPKQERCWVRLHEVSPAPSASPKAQAGHSHRSYATMCLGTQPKPVAAGEDEVGTQSTNQEHKHNKSYFIARQIEYVSHKGNLSKGKSKLAFIDSLGGQDNYAQLKKETKPFYYLNHKTSKICKKSLNLSSFLMILNDKTSNTYLTEFSPISGPTWSPSGYERREEKQTYSFSYQPFSKFDFLFYPFLFLPYLSYRTINCVESSFLSVKSGDTLCSRQVSQQSDKVYGSHPKFGYHCLSIGTKRKSTPFYANFKHLIPLLFETPCFSWDLISRLDSSFLKETEGGPASFKTKSKTGRSVIRPNAFTLFQELPSRKLILNENASCISPPVRFAKEALGWVPQPVLVRYASLPVAAGEDDVGTPSKAKGRDAKRKEYLMKDMSCGWGDYSQSKRSVAISAATRESYSDMRCLFLSKNFKGSIFSFNNIGKTTTFYFMSSFAFLPQAVGESRMEPLLASPLTGSPQSVGWVPQPFALLRTGERSKVHPAQAKQSHSERSNDVVPQRGGIPKDVKGTGTEFKTSFELAKTTHYSPFNGEIVSVKLKAYPYQENFSSPKQPFASLPSLISITQRQDAEVAFDRTHTQEINSPLISSAKKGSSVPYTLSVQDTQTQAISCMFLTKLDLISYYYPSFKEQHTNKSMSRDKKYLIKDIFIKFEKMSQKSSKQEIVGWGTQSSIVENEETKYVGDGVERDNREQIKISKLLAGFPEHNRQKSFLPQSFVTQQFVSINSNKSHITTLKQREGFVSCDPQPPLSVYQESDLSLPSHLSSAINKSSSLLGDFLVYGDDINHKNINEDLLKGSEEPLKLFSFRNSHAVQTSGQIIHYNNEKITLRRSQPIFISPKAILHKFDGDFVNPKAPVITLSYKQLKTGDIIQGIPKVEQFFEARTTKRGQLFRDSLPSLLKGLFKRFLVFLPLDLAVRQSIYKIQQIIVDGVLRVYKSQGVTIADKHLEVIVKQMTGKVRILEGAQTGFFPGEVLDLCFVEKINRFLIKKVTYEPLVLGITKASLEVESFLSAASFQQTTRVLSQAALYRKKDFLKGLKENVILGNLIPAGTGYLVFLNDVTPSL